MTTVCVLCDPPREGLVLPGLAEETPLSAAEAAGLYAAMLKDVCSAVAASGGDLLVNYRPDDALPEAPVDSLTQVRSTVDSAVDAEEARFEVQVGETFSGRAGNTVTHLLEREGATTVAVVEPTVAFLVRSIVDEAAMKLRRSEVVLGPSTRGRVYYAAFGSTVDFQDAYTPPAQVTLTGRALSAGHDVDFLPTLPVVETGEDLLTAVATIEARRAAGRPVPEHTATFIDGLGLSVENGDDGLGLVADTDRD
jgi:2-phospho-L-lactate guanylyltransferase (CobY/MobA/RfbA family)